MGRSLQLAAFSLVLVLAGCQSVEVSSEYGPGADLQGLGPTYRWHQEAGRSTDPWADNPNFRSTVREMIDRGLAERGYRAVDGDADFVVNYHASSSMHRSHFEPFTEGVLAVEITDPRLNELFWRGTARAKIEDGDTLEVREKRLTRAVESILKEMPRQRS